MARVVYGGGVTAFKGSVGGLTFQQNRSGQIVRRRPSTYKAVTVDQSESIQDFFQFQNLWQALDQSDVDDWNTFADTYTKEDMWGTDKTLSGNNWFTSINYYRVLISQSVLDAPPAYASAISVPSYTLWVKKNGLLLTYSADWGTSDDFLMIYTTYPVFNKTTNFRPALKLTTVVDAGPFSDRNITDDWESAHDLDYPPGQSNPEFYIGVALRTGKISSCIPGPASLDITQYDNTDGGIGFMQIGTTFVVS